MVNNITLQRHPIGCELKWSEDAEVIGDLDESSCWVVMGVGWDHSVWSLEWQERPWGFSIHDVS